MADKVCKTCAKANCNKCFSEGFTSEDCTYCMNQQCPYCIGDESGSYTNKPKPKTGLVGASKMNSGQWVGLVILIVLIIVIYINRQRIRNLFKSVY